MKALIFAIALLWAGCAHAEAPRTYSTVATVDFAGVVNADSVDAAVTDLRVAVAAGAEAIVLTIDTPGGSVFDGIRLAKVIEAAPVPVYCVVDTLAASMGFYLLQSCDVRLMTRRAMLMAHAPSGAGPQRGNAEDFEVIVQRLRALEKALSEHSCRRLKMLPGECAARMGGGRELWLTWAEALDVGAVDAVVLSVGELVARLRR